MSDIDLTSLSIRYPTPHIRHFSQISIYFNLLPALKLSILGELLTPPTFRPPLKLELGE